MHIPIEVIHANPTAARMVLSSLNEMVVKNKAKWASRNMEVTCDNAETKTCLMTPEIIIGEGKTDCTFCTLNSNKKSIAKIIAPTLHAKAIQKKITADKT